MQLLLPYADPARFLAELINKYGFKKHFTWDSLSLTLPQSIGLGYLQLFVKNDIHFFRGIWDFNQPTVFLSNDPVGKKGLIDFRISVEDQLIHSSSLEGAKKFAWEITSVNGIRFFIPEKYFNSKLFDLASRFHNCQYDPQIKQMIKKLFEIPNNDFSNTMLLDAKLTEFVFYLIRYLSNEKLDPVFSNDLPQWRLDCINEAHTIILGNLDKELSIIQLSRKVGLNECDLKRDFKRIYGYPIHQYIIQKKIESANKLISENMLSITETARSLGYTNTKYFEMLYKRYYGEI